MKNETNHNQLRSYQHFIISLYTRVDTPYGIMIYRRRIRKLIKSLKEGKEPPQAQNKKGDIIKTNGQDTVLRIPKRNIDDRKFIKSIGSNVMKLQFDAEKMPIRDRDNHIIKKLSEMEKRGAI